MQQNMSQIAGIYIYLPLLITLCYETMAFQIGPRHNPKHMYFRARARAPRSQTQKQIYIYKGQLV